MGIFVICTFSDGIILLFLLLHLYIVYKNTAHVLYNTVDKNPVPVLGIEELRLKIKQS